VVPSLWLYHRSRAIHHQIQPGLDIASAQTQDLLPTKTALFVVAHEPQIRGSNVDHGPIRGGSTSKGAALRTGGFVALMPVRLEAP